MLKDGADMVDRISIPPGRRGAQRPRMAVVAVETLSAMYRRVLNHKLATYTSCFRVYRRSALLDLDIREGGFLGVAEMLGRLDLRGGTIVECPAVLEVRLLGRSKMKTVRTIFGHLRLLARLTLARFGWSKRGI